MTAQRTNVLETACAGIACKVVYKQEIVMSEETMHVKFHALLGETVTTCDADDLPSFADERRLLDLDHIVHNYSDCTIYLQYT